MADIYMYVFMNWIEKSGSCWIRVKSYKMLWKMNYMMMIMYM